MRVGYCFMRFGDEQLACLSSTTALSHRCDIGMVPDRLKQCNLRYGQALSSADALLLLKKATNIYEVEAAPAGSDVNKRVKKKPSLEKLGGLAVCRWPWCPSKLLILDCLSKPPGFI